MKARYLGGLLAFGVAFGAAQAGLAQSVPSNIVPDDTLGVERSVVQVLAPSELITGGAVRGINLFHSFGEFNVGEGRSTYFIAPNSNIENILARVTGNNRSEILGKLGTALLSNNQFDVSNANLFLMNPNGILFGKNSSLDVDRSLFITTASGIQFSNQDEFSVEQAEPPTRSLTIQPSVFLFNQTPGDIVIKANQMNMANSKIASLHTPDKKTLLLLGGNIYIDSTQLNAMGGKIGLGSVAKYGTVQYENNKLIFPETIKRGDIQITKKSSVQTIGETGGSISILADKVTISGGSKITNGNTKGTVNLRSGDIIFSVTDRLEISEKSNISNTVFSNAFSQGGNIIIHAQKISVLDGATLQSSTFGSGSAGNILISNADLVIFDGISSDKAARSGIFSESSRNSIGQAGDIKIKAKTLQFSNGAALSSRTFGLGSAGDIFIHTESVLFKGTSLDGRFSSGAFSGTSSNSIGQGGEVRIITKGLQVQDGAFLSSSSNGDGIAGNILITSTESVLFDGKSSGDVASGAISVTRSNSNNQEGGNIIIDTKKLQISNGAILSSSTFGSAAAGDIVITNAESIILDGQSVPGRFRSSIFSGTLPNSTGKGGDIRITGKNVQIRNGMLLSSSASGKGKAGHIIIENTDLVTVDGVSADQKFRSTITSTTTSQADASGGDIRIQAKALKILNGAILTSSTFGNGMAGNITITNANLVVFDGLSLDGKFNSAATSQAEVGSNGLGGNIRIEAKTVQVLNGATLSSSTFSRNNAGNIFITSTEFALFDGVSSNQSFRSAVFSAAGSNSLGNSGDMNIEAKAIQISNGALLQSSNFGSGIAGTIVIRASEQVRLRDATVATASNGKFGGNIKISASSLRLNGDSNILTVIFSGVGQGGDVLLDANSIILLDDSDILTSAPEGRGGNITLNTPAFFAQNYRPSPPGTNPFTLDGNNRVDINASGTLSSGIITRPDTSFIQNNLTQLPNSQIDTNKLLAQTCLIRQDQPQGTFYITGTGGIPNRPNDPALSAYPTNTIQPTTPIAQKPWKLGDPIIEPQGFYKLANGRLVMSRECSSAPQPPSDPSAPTPQPAPTSASH